MPRVLVVDDSDGDRQLIGGILQADDALAADGLEIGYAEEGKAALLALERDAVDLVITDLQMPDMDGLELVTVVRRRFPRVPVVLTTSQGSEEIAVQALQSGAAGYVPKASLAGDLLGTIRRVLALREQQDVYKKLMERMVRNQCRFVLPNETDLVRPLVGYFQVCLALTGLCDVAERLRVGVAVQEALHNAIFHGNLEIGSESRGQDDLEFLTLADERVGQSPYRDRRVYVDARFTRSEARFVIRDEGPGFDPAALPQPGDSAYVNRTGRGIPMMRVVMDEVIFNDLGNQVTLIKRSAT